MSIVPYNANHEVLYHDPSNGILVLHNSQLNTIELLSTASGETPPTAGFPRENFSGTHYKSQGHGYRECPNCGFSWTDFPSGHRNSADLTGLVVPSMSSDTTMQRGTLMNQFPNGFIHHDYFKLLGKLPSPTAFNEATELAHSKYKLQYSIPEHIFNQDYFKRFFKKVPPYTLGSGAHAQVYKVIHVLNDINLGTYAVKRISVGDRFELLEQVLNEVLILYELLVKGANENNLIRYNHVWLELGDIDDSGTFFLSDKKGAKSKNKQIPYVFILQQYCGGGHLEDLIEKNFDTTHTSWKEKVKQERLRRRSVRNNQQLPESRKWLSSFEIWKFFRDVANGVHYLHLHRILHRDLKPSNCLLDSEFSNKTQFSFFNDYSSFDKASETLPKVLVSDFGEGRIIESHGIQDNEVHIMNASKKDRRGNTGTLEFTAPELWLFDPSSGSDSLVNEYSYESDIYSLGLILCYLCVGSLPFSEIVSNELDPAVVRSLIMDWYFDLNRLQFHEWFVAGARSRDISDLFLEKFETLVYMMIKSELGDNPVNRASSSEVLRYLDKMKDDFVVPDLQHEYTYFEVDGNVEKDSSDGESNDGAINLTIPDEEPVFSQPPSLKLRNFAPIDGRTLRIAWYLTALFAIEYMSYPYVTKIKMTAKALNIVSLAFECFEMSPTLKLSVLVVDMLLVLYVVISDVVVRFFMQDHYFSVYF